MKNLNNNIAEITTAKNSANQLVDLFELFEAVKPKAKPLTLPSNVSNYISWLQERVERISASKEKGNLFVENAKGNIKNSNLISLRKDGTWRAKFYVGKYPIFDRGIVCNSFDECVTRIEQLIAHLENGTEDYVQPTQVAIDMFNTKRASDVRTQVGHS